MPRAHTRSPRSRVERLVAACAGAVAALLLALPLALTGIQSASALNQPTLPEPVATYFASRLLPRLADLYGPGKKVGSGIDFDSTTKVGEIHRVFAWTPAFLEGTKTDNPTELTNNWVAPVTVRGQSIGLATVWINPTSDHPELSNFDLGPGLVAALEAAPNGTLLIRDDTHQAWFASDGTTISPLVSGTSGVAMPTTITHYREMLPNSSRAAPDDAGSSNGLGIAATVLGIVVVLVVLIVLLPQRRRRARAAAEVTAPGNEASAGTVVAADLSPLFIEPTFAPAERATSLPKDPA